MAHGALGAACLLLSTFDDRRASELVVKLDNFGFARMLRRPVRASDMEGARAILLLQRLSPVLRSSVSTVLSSHCFRDHDASEVVAPLNKVGFAHAAPSSYTSAMRRVCDAVC